MGTAVVAQTSLAGKVIDEETGEPIIFGNVAIYKGGNLITGTDTDFDGNYSFSNIDPGTYDVEVSYVGYQAQKVTEVKVLAGKSNKLDLKLGSAAIGLEEVLVTAYKVPLIEQDNTTSGKVITSDEIRNLPTRNINALAATSAGLASADEGDDVTVRGSRSESTNYYIDGIRVQGDLIPESEIDQLQVITGGIEAQYGDVTGGIISITTKGPSSKFSGGIEAETSNSLDAFNNNLVGVNFSGPILKNKKTGVSILGFRVAGRYSYNEDDDPSAVPVYQVKDEKLAELEANPIIDVGGDPLVAADFLRNEDVNGLKAQPNEDNTSYNVTAKIDARLSEAIDITLTGGLVNEKNRFTPNEDSNTLDNWRLLNSHNNPYEYDKSYRGSIRFRHRLGGGMSSDEGDQAKKSALIQNASYTLTVGYEKNNYNHDDFNHGENYFDYGYIGALESEFVPVFQQRFDSIIGFTLQHIDYQQVLRGYTPGTANPVLANYNNALGLNIGDTGLNSDIDYYVIQGVNDGADNVIVRTDFQTFNGTVPTNLDDSWGFHTNVGSIYNRVRKEDDDIYTFNATANFDLVPGGGNSRHNIQLGIAYEQRSNRRYDVLPRGLWTLARQNANSHILGIPFDSVGNPLSDVIGTIDIPNFGAVDLYQQRISETADETFYRKIRESLGVPLTEFIDPDGLTPDQLSLDMFSAKELNDQGLLDYYGYDYLGNAYDGNFDDFFSTVDANGVRTFPVAPNRPIYAAAYIQDKFTYKDIIFRLGVRIDRYDANTKVLKDKYSIYEIMGANEFHANNGGAAPGNIGEDFKVYLNQDGASVQAYRDGDQWYFPNGTPANDASDIIQGALVNPKYKDPRLEDNPTFIKSRDFDTDVSFEDYEVQVNVMPRLAFSFPISQEANFFAHYDILVQRPPTNTIATARDYFYFVEENDLLKNNPNLKPEKTIDYEVGFQQKLSVSSAIKIAAYYKEMRDMIQRREIFPVPLVGSYTTYDNIDFGTVKGFTFQYDLRRTGNISFNANYTLQFADGTGSDANSARGLTSRGLIRTLNPLNFDERHRLVGTLDYRYDGGDAYTGPELFGSAIFANAGINFQAIAVSGRPYTANITPDELTGAQIRGAINGARKPWNYTFNMRVDKTFKLANNMRLNVYMRISNLLDRRNEIRVYPVTGSPEDDGFLSSSRGLDKIDNIENSKREVEAYLASYQWRILNPNFYSLPRRIFVGASFSF
ncbi:MAG: hypothetical protein DHS20C18_06400 [Saprospiraceae bacterium]|nr:MAG: hypothetical protein DHS20C18_06400 [Saprospiraceae bacterium]